MKTCPKCTAKVSLGELKCNKCGCLLHHDDGTADTVDEWSDTPENAESDANATVDVEPSASDDHSTEDSYGTLPFDDLNATSPGESSTTDEPLSNGDLGTLDIDDPNKTLSGDAITLNDPFPNLRSPATPRLDDSTLDDQHEKWVTAFDLNVPRTVDSSHATQMPGSSDDDAKYMSTVDSEPNLRGIDSGSSGNKSNSKLGPNVNTDFSLSSATEGTGSDGKLNRVWEAAIGTSNRDLNQSLRFERAEASDSIFRRVARRKVADANSPNATEADYQIQHKLGDGGMGIVFSAIQNAVNRIVAVKSIKAEKQSNDSTRKQFFYEAEITADLDHPNIPPIYEMGTTAEDVLFYSMKLIQGTPWQKVINKITRDENLEIFAKIADAVAFAHSRNIIHRDLKPDNVMLGAYGEVYLMDWGLGVNIQKNKSIDFGGTPDFMAPEMAANKRKEIGKPSDVYLLGAILFQIIVGRAPHGGKTAMQRLQAAARNEIVESVIDDPLLEIARIALATDPKQRYASVEKLQEAIREVRRHAESIALSNRSKELADKASERKDYDSFTRSLYGFRDAIELWSDNHAAIAGLAQTRLAYGQCAFDRGDYDLAVQTLDRSVSQEAVVYDQAVKAKLLVSQRGQRLKTLRRVFMISVSSLSVLLAGAALYAWNQKTVAENAAAAEKIAKEGETKAKDEAIEAKEIALAAANAETKAKQEETIAKNEAIQANDQAIAAAKAEEIAKKQETLAKEKALAAAESERIAKEGETKAKQAAEQRTAQIQIGDAQSKTVLAKLQLERFDVQGGASLLEEIKSNALSEVFGEKAPKLDSWPLKRVSLLGNLDLPKLSLEGRVTVIEFASNGKIGIAGTENGKLHLLEANDGTLKIIRSTTFENGTINTVSISPTGDEAVFGLTANNKSQLFAWPLTGQPVDPVPIELLGNRLFQHVQYSPDGNQMIAGVNGGVWCWDRVPGWYTNLTGNKIRIIQEAKGQLARFQWLDSNSVLATTRQNERLTLHKLDLASKNAKIIPIPDSLGRSLEVVTYIGNANQFLFGRNDGSIFAGNLSLNVLTAANRTEIDPRVVELPKKHRTSITQITSGPSGEIVTVSSSEPVVHIWKLDPQGDIHYDTHLSGVPNKNGSSNLTKATFAPNHLLVGVDEGGTAMVWNIARQKQRRQLVRMSENGPDSYTSPVIGVFHRGMTNTAMAVNEDGVVDLWNLQDGLTHRLGGERWSYFGHTPGAEYVDSAVDMNAGVVVTSASLKNAQRKYLSDPNATQEFCIWHQASGNMLHRWAERSDEVIDPRISLLNGGKEILISSDRQTRILALDGTTVFQNKEVGTRFAVPNPRDPSLVAMVKLSGFTWLWDRKSGWNIPNDVYYREDRDGNPIKAVWSNDGNRLFQVFSNGRLYVYDLQGDKLVAAKAKREDDKKWKANFGKSLVVTRHFDLDLAVTSVRSGLDRLFVNVRIPSAQSVSRQTVVDVERSEFALNTISTSESPRFAWLDESNAEQPFDSRVHSHFDLNPSSRDVPVSRFRAGQQTFVSTRRGNVLNLKHDSSEFVSLGRQPLISTTSDRNGSILVTLHKDGALWKLDMSQDGSNQGNRPWSRLEFTTQGDSISMSPDGTQLLILDSQSGSMKIVDPSNGAMVRTLHNVEAAAWHPTQNATLAVAFRDGELEISGIDGTKALRNSLHRQPLRVKSVRFFTETWAREDSRPINYLLVQSEGDLEACLQFVPLEADGKAMEQSIRKGAVVASSPTDSVFVTGEGAGTVTVWIASPYWQRVGALFDLDGHLGAKMKTITFSHDGKTLVTSDSNHRLFGWLSEDATVRQ
ncbi:MAG: WD40 repeat domain-containing serine/threonine protein kinase [Pirellula sp.]